VCEIWVSVFHSEKWSLTQAVRPMGGADLHYYLCFEPDTSLLLSLWDRGYEVMASLICPFMCVLVFAGTHSTYAWRVGKDFLLFNFSVGRCFFISGSVGYSWTWALFLHGIIQNAFLCYSSLRHNWTLHMLYVWLCDVCLRVNRWLTGSVCWLMLTMHRWLCPRTLRTYTSACSVLFTSRFLVYLINSFVVVTWWSGLVVSFSDIVTVFCSVTCMLQWSTVVL